MCNAITNHPNTQQITNTINNKHMYNFDTNQQHNQQQTNNKCATLSLINQTQHNLQHSHNKHKCNFDTNQQHNQTNHFETVMLEPIKM